jgi:Aspartyl protease
MRGMIVGIFCLMVMALGLKAEERGPQANESPKIKFAEEVPLLDCDGTPCIEARIGDGKILKMGIDTGNVDSVVDTAVAEAAGLKPTAELPAGAPTGMFRTTIGEVSVGAVKLSNVPALSMALGEMISSKQIPRVDGTLAYTAFKDRILQFDFVAHKLRISDVLTSPSACSGACDKISLITFGNDGPPIVVADGFEINGKRVTAQVDTMYTGSLLVYTKSIEKLGFTEAAKTTKTRDFPLTDGGVKMKEAPSQKESFHGKALGVADTAVYFPTPDVHEPDGLFDATVGLQLFYGARLTLNFHDMTISVEKG